jgi:hypothetical protein
MEPKSQLRVTVMMLVDSRWTGQWIHCGLHTCSETDLLFCEHSPGLRPMATLILSLFLLLCV